MHSNRPARVLCVCKKVRSVLPISEDARRMIAKAASQAGMSVSDWLNGVILEAASRQGVSELHEVFHEDSQPEQVDFRPIFARLDQLADRIQALSQETADEWADEVTDDAADQWVGEPPDDEAAAPFEARQSPEPNRERALFECNPDFLAAKIRSVDENGIPVHARAIDDSLVHRMWNEWHEKMEGRVAPVSAHDHPLVSVCIPHRNRPGYLSAAVASLKKQTYRHVEILVGDDCSDDDDKRNVCAFGRFACCLPAWLLAS